VRTVVPVLVERVGVERAGALGAGTGAASGSGAGVGAVPAGTSCSCGCAALSRFAIARSRESDESCERLSPESPRPHAARPAELAASARASGKRNRVYVDMRQLQIVGTACRSLP
jgi:hypothetical protein